MDKSKEKFWVLGKGEEYIEPVHKPGRPVEKAYRFTYEQVRYRLKRDINSIREKSSQMQPKYRMDELVLCLRILPEFIAKSYYPQSMTTVQGITDIGSRSWKTTIPDTSGQGETEVTSKLIFLRTSDVGLDNLEQRLDMKESVLTERWISDVRRIDSLTFLRRDEAVLGFSGDWSNGRVEVVLHPFANRSTESLEKLQTVLSEYGVPLEKINSKLYGEGPAFVSVEMERQAVEAIAQFNPLRTIHPLQFDSFPTLRSAGNIPGPAVPSQLTRSSIKVGMFDGGIDEHNQFLQGFVRKAEEEIGSRPSEELKAHGTAVAGALLYGEISEYSAKDTLPTPMVTVESFRALPPSNSADFDLYESIDLIEAVVPSKSDIKVYNLSFGPKGPILDDHISRFTYALDKLAKTKGVLFNAAVGNDGDLPNPDNRVQSPADIVNGLGVGAYTLSKTSDPIRAEYSSIGAGREGCKVKPDVVAFGGCSVRPFHAIGDFGQRALTWGTSFASPLVARTAAELLGRCNEMTPLLARCLIIHTANNPSCIRDTEMGYGMAQHSLEDMLRSSDDTNVTVLYNSSLMPGKYAKLPIPVPAITKYNAKATITWTIALLSQVSTLNPDEYTLYGVEHTFYPNDSIYGFTGNQLGKKKTVYVDINKEPNRADALLAANWARSSLPKSDSSKKPTELDLRSQHLKWDTVVKNTVTKNLSSLHSPFLTLHAMKRNSGTDQFLQYAVAVTVSIPKYQGHLFNDIQAQYAKLQQIRVREMNEIMVSIS